MLKAKITFMDGTIYVRSTKRDNYKYAVCFISNNGKHTHHSYASRKELAENTMEQKMNLVSLGRLKDVYITEVEYI